MIPMECPTCGRQGEVPLDRLNSKLTCKKCGTVFHMDDTGHIVLGEPGAAKKKRVEPKDQPVEMDLGKVLRELPKPVRYGVPGVLGVLLLVWVVGKIVGSFSLASDLPTRAAYVGELFIDQQLDQIKGLTTPETVPQIEQWYNRVRPLLNQDGPRSNRDEVTSLAQVFREDSATAITFTALHVTNPKPATMTTSGQAKQNDLTIELVWVWSGGRWMLDGQGTLEAAVRVGGRRK